ncbi:MAG: DEAD/DEAH box helicase [Thermoplasmatales archaeon]
MDKRDIDSILVILRKAGFTDFTEPQKTAIPIILEGENVLLTAPTGSGKTEAAVLPVFHMLAQDKNRKGFGAVYVTPLRALNRDVLSRIEYYASSFGLEIGVRHGDSTQSERRYQTIHPPDVLITTPETLQLIITGKRIRSHLLSLRFLIVDEIHELMNDERGWQLLFAIARMREHSNFRIIALSATIGNPEEVARALFYGTSYRVIKTGLRKKYEISVTMPNAAPTEFMDITGTDENYAGVLKYILDIYETGKQFIVFSNTRTTAEDIVMRLRLYNENIMVDVHHGSLGREVRTRIEEDFRRGKLRGIVCTSSMELGIDIGAVDYVVQVNSPRQVTRLVQRIGRGRHRIQDVSEGGIVAMNEIEAEEGSVIAEFAERNMVEDVKIREKPMVVLANQIVSIANAERNISLDALMKICRRVSNFSSVSIEDVEKLTLFLSSVNLVKYDTEKKMISKSGRTLKYFIENISMIPDEKRFIVKESSSNRIIGFLDEAYVATEIDIGSTFILKGSTWRVLNIKDRLIYVDFIHGISVPPSWSGEEIPVPFEVAMEVGRERRERVLAKNLDKFTAERISRFRLSVGNDRLIRIEKERMTTIIQITGGSKVNYSLALLITFRLSEKYGESFLFDTSPYHILIQGNLRYSGEEVAEIIKNTTYELNNFDLFIEKSRTFLYSTVNVAKKFGILSKDSDYTKIRVDKIFSAHRDTPFFREAVEKFKWDYLDLEGLSKIGKMIEDGVMKIELSNSFSDSSKLYMANLKEKMMPIRPTGPILEAVKRRLNSEEMAFYCLSCNRVFKRRVSEMKERRCIFCSSPRIAPIKPYEIEELKNITPEKMNKIRTSYHLLRMYEDKALIVLAAHGIGPEAASRILEVPVKSENELIERILINEIEFARNRRFWGD